MSVTQNPVSSEPAESLRQIATAFKQAGYISDPAKSYERVLERLRALSPSPTTEIGHTVKKLSHFD